MIEIEKKFPVVDSDRLRQQLSNLAPGGKWLSETQSDEYFNHQQLKFEQQDIALRIRSVDDRHILTYKGPNQDKNTKIREEVEIEFSAAQSQKMIQILTGIGMHAVAKVNKRRENLTVHWQDAEVTASLDFVENVGDFVELELVVTSREEVPQAVAMLESLAKELGLSGPTTTSYLEMLISNQESG